MSCNFEVGDRVLNGDDECEVVDVIELGGDYYLKIKTPGGEFLVSCDDVVFVLGLVIPGSIYSLRSGFTSELLFP